MKQRNSILIVLGYILISTGCAATFKETAWQGYAPLGKEFNTFNPPQTPPAIEALPPKAENPTGEITLAKALALGLMQNPELIAFSWDIRSAEARMLQAGILPNPELSAEVENFGGDDEFKKFKGAETTVQISQLIEMGGKRSKRRQVARIERDLVCWDYESKRLDVFADITTCFWETYAAQENHAIAQELAKLAEQTYESVVERVRAGKVAPFEEVQAKVALSKAQIEVAQTYHALEAARKKLAATWGVSDPVFAKVATEPDGLVPVPDQQVLEKLFSNNPDVARWSTELERQRTVIALSDASAAPDVTFGFGLRYFNDTDKPAFVMGITVPLPVFNRNQGERLEARFNYAKTADDQRAALLRVSSGFGQAYQELSAAYLTAVALRDTALPAADNAFVAAFEGYREGKCSYIQVFEAQRTLFEVKREYITALADYHKAKIALERLIGQNMPIPQKPERG